MKKLIKLSLLLFTIHLSLVGISAQTKQKTELVVQTGHSDDVLSIVFSPDGKIFASASHDKTIKIWETESGKELRTFNGSSVTTIPILFSSDGKVLVGLSNGVTIKMWDVENGVELKEFYPYSKKSFERIESVWLSQDRKVLAGGSNEGTIRLWDVESGKELKTLFGQCSSKSNYDGVLFSPNGKILAVKCIDKTIRLFNVENGNELKTLASNWDPIGGSMAFSSDGKLLVCGSRDKTIKLWNVETGAEIITLTGHLYNVTSVSFSPNGKILASGSSDKTVKLWDLENGTKLIKSFNGHLKTVRALSFSPSGKILASGGEDGTIKLWDVENGKETRTFSGNSSQARSLLLSPDGKMLARKNDSGIIRVMNIENGKELRTFISGGLSLGSMSFNPTGNILASGGAKNTIKLWDMESGKELFILKGHSYHVSAVAFSPDGKIIASGSLGVVKIWNVMSGEELKSFTGDFGSVSRLIFSPDGTKLATDSISTSVTKKGENGERITRTYPREIKLWDIESGMELILPNATPDWVKFTSPITTSRNINSRKISVIPEKNYKVVFYEYDSSKKRKELFSYIALNENDWVVITPDGLFDASPGARKLMHYVVGLEPITLEQIKDLYYVPGLLQKIFKGEPLPKVELFSKKDLFPDVEFSQPKAGQLTVKLTNRGGGIGQVQIKVNDKEFVADARPKGFDVNAKETTLTVSLKDAPLKGKDDKIEVVAKNAAGSLTTLGTTRGTQVFNLDGNESRDTPNIYVIAGGISNYTGDNLKLQFAAKDAEDFAKALEIGATKLLGDKSKVHIRLLSSNGNKSNVKFNVPDAKISTATKKGFENAFADFKNATSNDVFIVYLAGHGVALNLNQNPNQVGGDTYLYLTQEATTTDKSVLSIENSRRAMAISSEELKDLMKQNKALKQVLVLDTCAAGALSNSLVAKRDLPSDQIKAIERLKDNTGFFVLMGSSADAVSYEASQYGQGLLTYSLLRAMRGEKLRPGDYADINEIFTFAKQLVPDLAKNIGGIQQPLTITPDVSGTFDIGRFTTEEQKQIVLSNPKPLILRPNLQNEKLRFDNLKLSALFRDELRNISFVEVRGSSSPIVFVEADEMTDAITPSGSYTVDGETLKIALVLVKNNEQVGKEISVTGKVSEKEALIKAIVAKLTEAANLSKK